MRFLKKEETLEENLKDHQAKTDINSFSVRLVPTLTQPININSSLVQISHAPFPSTRKGDNSKFRCFSRNYKYRRDKE